MKQVVETDIAIIGGGVSGLWLLNRLRDQGYSVILLESATLGGGQTHKAQGIIHGGIKYALQGVLTNASQAIADMPTLWKQCLQGHGEIDLSHVPILSQQQYLWSTGTIASKLAGFFAGFALNSSMQALPKDAYPSIFQHHDFDGQVYSLDEMVIDTHALIRELTKPHQDVIFKIDPLQSDDLEFNANNQLTALKIHAAPLPPVIVKAKQYIFTAGSGNEWLIQQIKNHTLHMQRRPLHMAIVKHDIAHPVFAHCLGLGSTPRLTITSHRAHDGKYIWYIGGQVAEEGVKRTSAEQITCIQQQLTALFPWIDFGNASYATFFIDRAENQEPNGSRPDSCTMHVIDNMIVAWPTKLALAPALAKQIEAHIKKILIPGNSDMRELRAWPMPAIAKPIWDQLLC